MNGIHWMNKITMILQQNGLVDSVRVLEIGNFYARFCVAVHLFVRVFVAVQSRRVLGQWCPLVTMTTVESPPRGSVGREHEARRRRKKLSHLSLSPSSESLHQFLI